MKENELIAEFMGVVFHDDENQYYDDNGLYIGEELQYHKSWDWLMLVVDEIEDMGCEVVMTNGECTISADGYHAKTFGKSRRSATYDAVVEFIEWYNKKQ